MTQRIFSDEGCLDHQVPFGYPESHRRLELILESLDGEWQVEMGSEHEEVDVAVAAVHEGRYVESFRRAVERGDGLLGSSDNPLSKGTWEAARTAVGVALRAVDWALDTRGGEAFVAIRPPGHHAERNLAMGFCYFNNVAIAAEYMLQRHRLDRVAIFDFDVHHGNGTQHIFESRAEVLYISIHQWPFYPGTGSAEEVGTGAGRGTTINIPLPGGQGDAEYREVLERRVLPAIRDFSPAALLVSAGFDAWRADPLGGMRVTEAGFADWGGMLRQLATECCQGRLLSLLEGGYDLGALPELIRCYLRGDRGLGR